jgi:hypothetical protein
MQVGDFYHVDIKKKTALLQNDKDGKYDSCLQVVREILLTEELK